LAYSAIGTQATTGKKKRHENAGEHETSGTAELHRARSSVYISQPMVAGCGYGWEVEVDHSGTDIGVYCLDANVYTQFLGSEIHWHATPDKDPWAYIRPGVGWRKAIRSRPLPIAE